MGTYALSAGYYDAYYKRAQQVGCLRNIWVANAARACSKYYSCLTDLPARVLKQVRTLVQREMGAALQRYDALLCPAAPTPAYRLGEKTSDPLAMYKGALIKSIVSRLDHVCFAQGGLAWHLDAGLLCEPSCNTILLQRRRPDDSQPQPGRPPRCLPTLRVCGAAGRQAASGHAGQFNAFSAATQLHIVFIRRVSAARRTVRTEPPVWSRR